MTPAQGSKISDLNTVAMLGRAYSLLGFQIGSDGVVGAGFPQKPSHSAVLWRRSRPEGLSASADLARGANITPRPWVSWLTELQELGYVERRAGSD